jgi:voltage-gated sodium channel
MKIVVQLLLSVSFGWKHRRFAEPLVFYVAAVIATQLFGQIFSDWFAVGASLYTATMTLESLSMGIVRPLWRLIHSPTFCSIHSDSDIHDGLAPQYRCRCHIQNQRERIAAAKAGKTAKTAKQPPGTCLCQTGPPCQHPSGVNQEVPS